MVKQFFARDIPTSFSGFARSGFPLDGIGLEALKLPFLSITAFVVILLSWFILEQTTFGRKLYAIGGNSEAAHLADIKVKRLRLLPFFLTGIGSATAGFMYASRVASANPTHGSSYCFAKQNEITIFKEKSDSVIPW